MEAIVERKDLKVGRLRYMDGLQKSKIKVKEHKVIL